MTSVTNSLLFLTESYSRENVMLFQYLQKKPLTVGDLYYELSEWHGWDDALQEIGHSAEELSALAAEDNMDTVWEICHKLESWFDQNESAKNDAAMFLMRDYPDNAPTWAHLSLNGSRLLPSQTWLVHWTDDALDISAGGFTHGTDDPTRLGLTLYRNKESKKFGGYNFAFRANSRYASNPDRRYGSEVVIFQSSGVDCFHGGDDEDQVIFWGQSITSRPIAISHHTDDDKWEVLGKKGRVVAFDTVEECFKWVIQHSSSYRSSL